MPTPPLVEDCDCNTPSVLLNYVYVIVDAQTLDAINESPFISDYFALFGHSTPGPFASETTPAVYMLGRTTCMELIVVPRGQTHTVGNAGLCFSTKGPGQINDVYNDLRMKLGPRIRRGYSTFNAGTERVPWLRYVSSHSPRRMPPLLTWVTEHEPAFHKVVGPNSKCRITEAARTEPVDYAEKFFRDITAVTLELTQSEFDDLDAELSAYGFPKKEEQGLTVFSSPDMEIRVAVCDDAKYRIREIHCAMTTKFQNNGRVVFGDNATLTITKDGTATWHFGPAQPRLAAK